MKKFTFISLMVCLLVFAPITVFGQDYEYEHDDYIYDYDDDTVVITYEQALEMALSDMLPMQDIDALLRTMQSQRNDLRSDLTRLERGERPAWLQDDIRDLTEMQWQLHSMMIMNQHSNQIMLNSFVDNFMDIITAALGSAGVEDTIMWDPALEATLQAAVHNMVRTLGMGDNTIAAQHSSVVGQLASLTDSDFIRDLTEDTRHSMNDLDRQMSRLRLQQEQMTFTVENVLRSTIISVANQAASIELMEAELALSEEDMRMLTIRYEFGMISSNELRIAEHNLLQEQRRLSENLLNQYILLQSMNHFLQQPLSQLTAIELDRELPEIPEDLAEHIAALVPETPPIRQYQIAIDSANANLRRHITRANRIANSRNLSADERQQEREARTALQDAYDRAVAERNQAIATMEAAMRRAYYEFENLVFQQLSNYLELAHAQSLLETALTNLELGRITPFQAEQATMAVLRAEQNIERTLNQKWLLAFRLEHPSLL